MSLNALRLASLAAAALAGATPAAADLSCTTADVVAALRRGVDADAGDIRCRSDRTADVVRQDVLDGLTVRSSDQSDDAVGDIIDGLDQPAIRPAPMPPRRRPSFTASPDGLGGAILRDDAGAIYAPPTDGQGNSTFFTNDGQIVRCHTSDAGVTTCD